ncbi:MAG: hypothetical protein KAS72_14765 [Phycisphaerales bacterium]|nr:hypothetical protein [Phycisphaerales bacterium]
MRSPHNQPLRPNAIVGDQRLGIREVRRHARRGDIFASLDLCGDVVVQIEQLLEEILLRGEAVGLEDSLVEGCMGVLERVLAGSSRVR